MAEKVKLSKDGSSIDFVVSENLPTSLKKFRQSPDIEGFYRFIYENDLQKEVYDILDRIITVRKAAKSSARKEAKAQAAAVAASMKAAANPAVKLKSFKEEILPVKDSKSKKIEVAEVKKPTPAKAAPPKAAAKAKVAKAAKPAPKASAKAKKPTKKSPKKR